MLIVCLVFKKLPDDLPKWPHHSASHQPWMRVPVAPRPHQYVVMSVFSVHFILVCESCNTWDAVGVKKKWHLFTWNSNLPGRPVFYLTPTLLGDRSRCWPPALWPSILVSRGASSLQACPIGSVIVQEDRWVNWTLWKFIIRRYIQTPWDKLPILAFT